MVATLPEMGGERRRERRAGTATRLAAMMALLAAVGMFLGVAVTALPGSMDDKSNDEMEHASPMHMHVLHIRRNVAALMPWRWRDAQSSGL